MGAFDNLTRFMTSLVQEDLRAYDVVAPVEPVYGGKPDDTMHIFVGKEGEGEFIEMSREDLQAQLDGAKGGINLKTTSVFAVRGADQIEKVAVSNAKTVLMGNLDIITKTDPEVARGLMETTGTMDNPTRLYNAVADLTLSLHEAASDSPDVTGLKTISPEEYDQRAPAVTAARNDLAFAANLDTYRQSFLAELPNSGLSEEKVAQITQNVTQTYEQMGVLTPVVKASAPGN